MMIKDYEAAEGIDFLPEPSHNGHELLAEFESAGQARRAQYELLRAGLPEDEIDFAATGEEVSTRWGLAGDDRSLLGEIAARMLLGGLGGAILGGLTGLGVGLAFATESEHFGITVIAAAVVGILVGWLLGGVAGVCHALTQDDFRAQHPVLDRPVLAVHADSEADLDRAEEVLRGHPTLRLYRI